MAKYEGQCESPRAFPLENADENQRGMSLRDYFAAKAMHAVLVATERGTAAEVASEAYALADAMLDEREKGGRWR